MLEQEKNHIKYLTINVIIPIFLTYYFLGQEVWRFTHGLTDEGDPMSFLTLFLAVFIAPTVLLMDLYSMASDWKPEIGSDSWQLKFFSKVLYFVLGVNFFLHLIF